MNFYVIKTFKTSTAASLTVNNYPSFNIFFSVLPYKIVKIMIYFQQNHNHPVQGVESLRWKNLLLS